MVGILKPKRQTNSEVLAEVRTMGCIVCQKRPADPAHIKSRGSGGGDYKENLMPLCRMHHTMQHAKGHNYMMAHFPPYKFYLEKLGWTTINQGGIQRLWHPKFG